MSNSLFTIKIYRFAGTWCFTDKKRNLINEPFISGIPELIDECIEQINPQKDEQKLNKSYRITFSEKQFPGALNYLRFLFEEYGGAWYSKQIIDEEIDLKAKTGWLCPATLKFFVNFPKKIYFLISSIDIEHTFNDYPQNNADRCNIKQLSEEFTKAARGTYL